ncbi:patatin-like phospholipase family protein [Nonomuraea sp. NPDC000554]|uniref:patatin-like phospholipase family protein n=1 Tax=Nonomuraea sp. NPDC000554 TaxID=3154259 RepID=UPI00332BEE77
MSRALVLGPGGVVGTAWMAGLANGLRRHGVNLAEADLIVGTSAGAIIGAMLATGEDLDRLAASRSNPAPTNPSPTNRGAPNGAAPTASGSHAAATGAGRTGAGATGPGGTGAGGTGAGGTGATAGDAVLDGSRGGPDARAPLVDHVRLGQVFETLGDATLSPADIRRRVGRLALDAATGPEEAHLARMGRLVTTSAWPDGRLLIPAVDTVSGDPEVWDARSGAPLAAAVAASTAMPAVFPPITINGRRYMDGFLRAGLNADLAAGADVLVAVEPLAHLHQSGPLDRDLAGTIVTITADKAAQSVFGLDPHDLSAWHPSYQAGLRQADDAAQRVATAWHNR